MLIRYVGRHDYEWMDGWMDGCQGSLLFFSITSIIIIIRTLVLITLLIPIDLVQRQDCVQHSSSLLLQGCNLKNGDSLVSSVLALVLS